MKEQVGGSSRALSLSGLLLLTLQAWGCDDSITDPFRAGSDFTVTEPVLVDRPFLSLGSNQVASPAPSSSASGPEGLTFVSFEPGSLQFADSIEVRNLHTGAVVGAPVIGGGVDPTPIPASVGDSLQITVFGLGEPDGIRRLFKVVPSEEPPVVVRTDPHRRRTKVPLNTATAIIFSEPIDPSTVDPETVKLMDGDSLVLSTLGVSDDGLRVELTPDRPLKGATTYTISVGTAVRDLSGSQLQAGFESEFTTTDEVGTIRVMTETVRAGNLEPDGYWMWLDGFKGPHIGVQDTVLLEGIGVGWHQVDLTDIGPTCNLPSSEGQVIVRANQTSDLRLKVVCYPGILDIYLFWVGQSTDPDGVVLTVDDSISLEFSANLSLAGPWWYEGGFEVGERKLELTGLSKNCSLAGDNPRMVTIVEGVRATVTFDIHCYSGFIEVTTATSGQAIDIDGYQLVVDGAALYPIASNGVSTLLGIAPGDRHLHLTEIADNCTLSGENPKTLTVLGNGVGASVRYELTCTTKENPSPG